MDQPFFERLEQRCLELDSLLCVGLDPHQGDLPAPGAAAARDFCLRLIDATAPFAVAFKPNSAFFEVFGAEGFQALKDVIAAVPAGIPVVLDAKRGDIGTSAQAYAQAAFQTLGAHAITANPYLGQDSLLPFLQTPARAIFVLCKTSNPGAADLQDLSVSGHPVYMQVAKLAQEWNKNKNIGLVVGATYPEVLDEVRDQAPELWFLTPGIGTQGADLEAALAAGLRDDGLGMLVPISRGISQAENPRQAAEGFRDAMNAARKSKRTHPKKAFRHARLAEDLLQLGCVQFGEFTLKSGKVSPIYLDLRRLVGDPAALARAAAAYVELLRPLQFDRVAGLPYAALPIAAAISLQSGWPMIYPRKEAKDYGTKSAIEGPYAAGETVAVIDDLITTGGSKLEGISKLEAARLLVRDIVVLVNRQSESSLELDGYQLHSVFQISELLKHWQASGAISEEQFNQVNTFLKQD